MHLQCAQSFRCCATAQMTRWTPNDAAASLCRGGRHCWFYGPCYSGSAPRTVWRAAAISGESLRVYVGDVMQQVIADETAFFCAQLAEVSVGLN